MRGVPLLPCKAAAGVLWCCSSSSTKHAGDNGRNLLPVCLVQRPSVAAEQPSSCIVWHQPVVPCHPVIPPAGEVVVVAATS